MSLGDLVENVKENRLKSALIALVLVVPIAVPLIIQKYFNYSAINTSFAITVTYFVIWKLYEYRDEIRVRLNP